MNLQLLTTNDAFQVLRDEWDALAQSSVTQSIFLTWEWQYIWWQHFGQPSGRDATLCLVVGRDAAGRLCALAPLYAQRQAGGRNVLRILGDNDISDYLDLLVLPACANAFAERLLPFLLAQQQWHAFELGCLPRDAFARRLVAEASQTDAMKGDEAVEISSPSLILPARWDEYLDALPSKSRHELRRKIRKAEREGWLSLHIVRTRDKAPQALATLYRLMQKSRADKQAFLQQPMQDFFSEVALALSDRGWLELVELRSSKLPLAALYAFDFANTLYVYNSGFEPTAPALSPGLVIIAYHIMSGIERGRTEYDFMRGDEDYKYRFGATDAPLYRVCLERLVTSSPGLT